MQEFFVVVTRKLDQPLSPTTALTVLEHLAVGAVSVTPGLVREAATSSIRNQLSLWDALIVRAAVRAGCDRLLSEDLQDGQLIDGVLIDNPF